MSTVAAKVIDPIRHERLLADLSSVCDTASIPAHFIHKSMRDDCNAQEIDWVLNFKKYRQEGTAGLMLSGENTTTRCMLICAALLRNFIDARVMLLNSIINSSTKTGSEEAEEPTVLIVPNLHFTTEGKAYTSWQVQSLHDVLLRRFVTNKPTVVAFDSLDKLGHSYGISFLEHLKTNFKQA